MPIVKARRRVWRGNDRGYLRKLQKAIVMMTARDQRAGAFADATGAFVTFFDNTVAGTLTAKMQDLLNRIDVCLQETA